MEKVLNHPSAPNSLLTLKGLRHAALPAQDLERAIIFYRDLLGFCEYHVADNDWAMLHQEGTFLSLVKGDCPPENIDYSELDKHPAHLGIIAKSPEQVDEWHSFLSSKIDNANIWAPQGHRDRSHGFYFLDSERNLLELIYIPQNPIFKNPFQKKRVVIVWGDRDLELEKAEITFLKKENPWVNWIDATMLNHEEILKQVKEFAKTGTEGEIVLLGSESGDGASKNVGASAKGLIKLLSSHCPKWVVSQKLPFLRSNHYREALTNYFLDASIAQ